MSTPVPPGNDDALQATQQQLDELETLIQRMLTLPVNQLDEDESRELPTVPPFPESLESREPTETRMMEPAAALESAMETAETVGSIELPELSPTPFVSRFDFLDSTSLDMPDRTKTGFDETPEGPRSPVVAEEKQAPVPAPRARPRVKAVPVITTEKATPSTAPPIDWWLWLLVKINRLFDRSTCHLGRPGRRLRSEGGRAVLGWLGVVMLMAGLLLALLDWIRRNW